MPAKPIPSPRFVRQLAAIAVVALLAGMSPFAVIVLLGCIVREG